MSTRLDVRLRGIYDDPHTDDGIRVLVDRLWPRGVSKSRAAVDEWCRAVAPSHDLRTWYGHAPERFDEFVSRYLAELDEPERAAALRHLGDIAARGRLTLLTATKTMELSHGAVLVRQFRG